MLLECKVWAPHPLMYACRMGKLPILHTAKFKKRVLSVEACSSCLLLSCHECKLLILIKLIMSAVASLHGGSRVMEWYTEDTHRASARVAVLASLPLE